MNVLIVDDERHVRDAVQLLVPWHKYGFDTCYMAASVSEACALLSQVRIELAIVDVVIGEEFGMEIAEYIQNHAISTRTIVISGHDDFQYVRAMFILGSLEYLLKPIEQEPLLKAVEKAVADIRREEPPMAEPDEQQSKALMQEIAEYLQKNYSQRIRQQEIADMFFLNREYLSRAFKKYIGTGMARYLQDLRIQEAERLLLHTDLQIQEIADRVGFFDAKYFSLQFRKQTGMSPLQYRQEHKK
jgi:YesN/AraC family two-component response regulator